MPDFVFDSLMEKKAKEFPALYSPEEPTLLEDALTTRIHIRELSRQLTVLSKHLQETREALRVQERQFLQLADYKYKLEKTLISPRLVTTVKKKDKTSELLEKLEALTPEQLEKLEDIRL